MCLPSHLTTHGSFRFSIRPYPWWQLLLMRRTWIYRKYLWIKSKFRFLQWARGRKMRCRVEANDLIQRYGKPTTQDGMDALPPFIGHQIAFDIPAGPIENAMFRW